METVDKYSTQVLDTLLLTQSFRFGTEIAFVASLVMNKLCKQYNEREQYVLSSDRNVDVLSWRKNADQKPTKRMVILARTNVRLFDEIIELVCKRPRERRPKIAILMEGIKSHLESLAQISFLKRKMFDIIPKDSRLKKFTTYEEYKKRSLDTMNIEDLNKCKTVEKYTDRMAEYCGIIYEQLVGHSHNCPKADFIFSTVHKFKGLEFPVVRLLDDFLFEKSSPIFYAVPPSEREEANILYVALTRAKKELILNDSLVFFLFGNGKHNFDLVVPDGGRLVDRVCAVPTCLRPMGSGITALYNALTDGYYCAQCASAPQKRVPIDFTTKPLSYEVDIAIANDSARFRQTLVGVEVGEDNHEELLVHYKTRPFEMRLADPVARPEPPPDLFAIVNDQYDFLFEDEEIWDEDDFADEDFAPQDGMGDE